MKGSRWVKCIVTIIIIACVTFINFAGIPKTKFKNAKESMRYGIDISGGINAIYEPVGKSKSEIKIEQLDSAKTVLDLRLEGQAIFDKYVNVDKANKRLSVEIPYKPGQKADPQETLKAIGETAKLTFREVDLTKAEDQSSSNINVPAVTDDSKATVLPSDSKKDEKESATTTPENSESTASSDNKETATPTASANKESTKPTTTPISDEKLWADNKIVLTGDDVESASAVINPSTNQPEVSLEFKKSGVNKFSEATERLAKVPNQQGKIAIYLDDKLISYPYVSSHIPDGQCSINGQFTNKEAKKLANQISAGALPFKLKNTSISTISPTLGENAMLITVYAGILAFIIIFIFMLILYRLPGFVAMIALTGLVAALVLIVNTIQISLTLPGIAGIILTIGMGVDANIIIFARLKEELNSGKTLMSAIDVAFKRAFTAIFDSNATTIISGAVLLWLGSGPIKGFAWTLIIGVTISFISAIFATRLMLQAFASLNIFKARWFYGVKGGEVENGKV